MMRAILPVFVQEKPLRSKGGKTLKVYAMFAPTQRTSPIFASAFAEGCGGTVAFKYIFGRWAGFACWDYWEAIQTTRKAGLDWYYGDHAYLGRGEYYRVTPNAYQQTTLLEKDRWNTTENKKRLQALNIKIQPWRKKGSHILICPPPPTADLLRGIDVEQWKTDVLCKLKTVTDRPIRFREGTTREGLGYSRYKGPLEDDFNDAWAVITAFSGVAIDAVLGGIPVFCTHPCAATPMDGFGLSQIETPHYSDCRRDWLLSLMAGQWTLEEIRSGMCWDIIGDDEMTVPVKEERKWKKIGGGSLRWKGRIIKTNQTFNALESELPTAFVKQLVPVINVSRRRKQLTIAPIQLTEEKVPGVSLFKNVKVPDTVYIIGGGVSIEDVNLTNLDGEFVIVVNRAYQIYPKADIHFFGDKSFFEEHKKGVLTSSIPYKVSTPSDLSIFPELTIMRRNPTKAYRLDPGLGHLVHQNSGLMAVNLAYQLGARLVVLLGMDLKETKGRKHFHDGYKHPSPPKSCEKMLEEWKGIRIEALDKDIDFLHATPNSALSEVEYLSLEQIKKNTKTMEYYGGWWLPKGEEHFRFMLRRQRTKRYKNRCMYQHNNKMQPALTFMDHREGIAVDIGSNVGFWTFPLAHEFKKVHCFEPIPLHNACWKQNLAGVNNVVLHKVGLSDTPGKLSFTSPEGSCGGTYVSETGITYPIKTLDSFNLKNVSFLKVDCEGFELPILQGAEETLKKCKPLVVVEQKKEWDARYPFEKLGAVHYLRSLGATLKKEIGGDYIMRWE